MLSTWDFVCVMSHDRNSNSTKYLATESFQICPKYTIHKGIRYGNLVESLEI